MTELEVRWFPVLDTGIGREAGYENDEALMEAGRRASAAMSEHERAVAEAIGRDIERRFLLGE